MIACIGGVALDRRARIRGPLSLGNSNPGELREDYGGVARNVAQNLAHLGCPVSLVSRVGGDEIGSRLLRHAAACGIDVSLVTVSASRTASYTAILDNTGELVLGLDDMDVCEEITPEMLEPILPRLREHTLWFADTNLCGEAIEWLLDHSHGIPVAVDAISPARAMRLVPLLPAIDVLFCNRAQAEALGSATTGRARVVSEGANGITIYCGSSARHLPALPAHPRDVTGAGDALIAGTLFGLSQGKDLASAAHLGLAAAAVTVESDYAAVPDLTPAVLEMRLAHS